MTEPHITIPNSNYKCYHCKETKPIIEFIRNRSKASGYSNICKLCSRIVDKKRRGEKKKLIKRHPELFRFIAIKSKVRPVAQYSKDGVFIKRFDSAKAAAIKTNIQATHIHRAASSRRLTAGGFRWKYIFGTDVGLKNALCQCCGKLFEADVFATVSIECLRRLKGQEEMSD